MKAFLLEFRKTHRRKIWLIVLLLLATQLAWALWAFRNMSASDIKQGWLISLYQFPMLNAIIMPIIAAIIASRLCDIEHKGNTLKLLKTLVPSGRLFDMKFLSGSVYMLITAVLQAAIIIVNGLVKGFEGGVPFKLIGYYLLSTLTVDLTILLLQQVLSLLFANQMISFTIGLIGSFAGLFLMFFPQNLQKLIPWGYYGVLMSVGLDWNRATRVSRYYLLPVHRSDFVLLIFIFIGIYAAGRSLFNRREI